MDELIKSGDLSNRYGVSTRTLPQFQPGSCRFEENIPDFFSQDPEDAMRREHEIVRDFTPMVIMDLIQLTAKHEKVICENDIDIDNIMPIVTNAVMISNFRMWDDWCDRYESHIRRRDIPDNEKERLIRKVKKVWGKGKLENPRETVKYGIKQIFWDENSTVERTADEIAEYFGLSIAK